MRGLGMRRKHTNIQTWAWSSEKRTLAICSLVRQVFPLMASINWSMRLESILAWLFRLSSVRDGSSACQINKQLQWQSTQPGRQHYVHTISSIIIGAQWSIKWSIKCTYADGNKLGNVWSIRIGVSYSSMAVVFPTVVWQWCFLQ